MSEGPYRKPGEGSSEPDLTGNKYRNLARRRLTELFERLKHTHPNEVKHNLKWDGRNLYKWSLPYGIYEKVRNATDLNIAYLPHLHKLIKTAPSYNKHEAEAYSALKKLDLLGD